MLISSFLHFFIIYKGEVVRTQYVCHDVTMYACSSGLYSVFSVCLLGLSQRTHVHSSLYSVCLLVCHNVRMFSGKNRPAATVNARNHEEAGWDGKAIQQQSII